MKIPISKLKSEDLKVLFQKSSFLEQHFFPRKVPSAPLFDSPSKNLGACTNSQGKIYKKSEEIA